MAGNKNFYDTAVVKAMYDARDTDVVYKTLQFMCPGVEISRDFKLVFEGGRSK